MRIGQQVPLLPSLLCQVFLFAASDSPVLIVRKQKNAGNGDCISGVMMNSAKALSGIICTERTRYPSQREP